MAVGVQFADEAEEGAELPFFGLRQGQDKAGTADMKLKEIAAKDRQRTKELKEEYHRIQSLITESHPKSNKCVFN